MTARGPAPIQISTETTDKGHRRWNVHHNGEKVTWFNDGESAIECVHNELVAHEAHLRALEAQRSAVEAQRNRERNAALAKGAVKILGLLAASVNKNK